jgi:hypothetical protein
MAGNYKAVYNNTIIVAGRQLPEDFFAALFFEYQRVSCLSVAVRFFLGQGALCYSDILRITNVIESVLWPGLPRQTYFRRGSARTFPNFKTAITLIKFSAPLVAA